MSDLYAQTTELFTQNRWIQTTAAVALLIFTALVAHCISKRIALQGIRRAIDKKRGAENQKTLNLPVSSRLANIVPAIVIGAGIHTIPHLPEAAVKVTQNVAFAFIALTVAIAVGHLLAYINILYLRRPENFIRPIKGYLQLGKLVIYLIRL